MPAIAGQRITDPAWAGSVVWLLVRRLTSHCGTSAAPSRVRRALGPWAAALSWLGGVVVAAAVGAGLGGDVKTQRRGTKRQRVV